MEGAVEFIATTFRFSLAAVFLIAGLSKLGRRTQFERAVRSYGLVPARAAPVVAAALPPAEIAGGVLLGAGVAVPVAAAFLAGLLGVFTAAVAWNLARGRRIDCGCFGTGVPREITWLTAARNVALAAMAAIVAATAPRVLSLDALVFGTSGDMDHHAAVAGLVVATAALTAAALVTATLRLHATKQRLGEVLVA